MIKVEINLYSFKELSSESQELAIGKHCEFLNDVSIDEGYPEYDMYKEEDKEVIVEDIEANAYIFYKDGRVADCTTFTGKHPKAGTTEFTIHSETYKIKNGGKR